MGCITVYVKFKVRNNIMGICASGQKTLASDGEMYSCKDGA